MQQRQGLVSVRAAEVHVLAENGELLGQVAVACGNLVETRLVEDLPVAPPLEGVGASAATQGRGAGRAGKGLCRGRRLPRPPPQARHIGRDPFQSRRPEYHAKDDICGNAGDAARPEQGIGSRGADEQCDAESKKGADRCGYCGQKIKRLGQTNTTKLSNLTERDRSAFFGPAQARVCHMRRPKVKGKEAT